jgi:DNA sulfur modification protein DndB
MASVYPAMRGSFGSTEYFIIVMKASAVANQLVIPKEMPDWDDQGLEERFQREVNYTRVKKHIAPYLAHDKDRFFGSLIVDMINPGEIHFEKLNDVFGPGPTLYKTAAEAFGFLTLSGGEMLVPLDGQHRLAAIKFALSGKDEKQKDIPNLVPAMDLANDDVTLILVRHDPEKARKIFNKVNRYAKSVSKADNLITADDDIVAVISREEIANDLIGERIVNYKSNTLSTTSHYFTTLATIYESTNSILESKFGKIDIQALPDPATQGLFKQEARRVWDKLLNNITVFKLALQDTSEGGDEKREEIRKDFILGKPLVQQAVVIATNRLLNSDLADGTKLGLDEIVSRIDKLNWKTDNALWQRVIMNGERIVSGKQSINFAARFIAYLLGEQLEDVELKALQEQYLSSYSDEDKIGKALPTRIFKPK